jgi:hypothetical protein
MIVDDDNKIIHEITTRSKGANTPWVLKSSCEVRIPRCHVPIKTKDTRFENKFLMNIDVGLG